MLWVKLSAKPTQMGPCQINLLSLNAAMKQTYDIVSSNRIWRQSAITSRCGRYSASVSSDSVALYKCFIIIIISIIIIKEDLDNACNWLETRATLQHCQSETVAYVWQGSTKGLKRKSSRAKKTPDVDPVKKSKSWSSCATSRTSSPCPSANSKASSVSMSSIQLQ